MESEIRWHEEHIEKWEKFTELIGKIERRYEGQQHHFFYRGQINKQWGLKSSFLREIKKTENLSPERYFQIEKDAQQEFASQVHLHLDPSALPASSDWLEWWALMQHYGATTRLLDWSASPYVAAYFAVESGEDTDGLIWVLNDWALRDRMRERHSADWSEWDRLPRPPNNWSNVAKSFKPDRFFNEDAVSQIFFFQPDREACELLRSRVGLAHR